MKIPEEVLFDIEMEVYDKYNHQIALMYDWLGEIYTHQDIKEMEELEKAYKKTLIQDYLEGKRKYSEGEILRIKNYLKERKE